ncbi:hypothetical protein [Chryseobacterium sp. Bi04]|uniref:hypothetical protein n=1 Tax=Chryseobacterium sp. Bi04 TaxID=2822345 RepID=UPI001E409D0B|nr:hypothetical protein [Chryseobacterium sp. Bi04]
MKTSIFKKLNRQEQKEISGSGIIKKCSESSQCDPFQCCMGGICLFFTYSGM